MVASSNTTAEYRAVLLQERTRTETRLAGLQRAFDEFVEGAEYVNTDDEHDPEGSTIAYERAQVIALRDEAAARLESLDRALEALDAGEVDRCVACGGPIGSERLLALPGVDTCVGCAR